MVISVLVGKTFFIPRTYLSWTCLYPIEFKSGWDMDGGSITYLRSSCVVRFDELYFGDMILITPFYRLPTISS